jgi:hypothetical protein
MKLLNDIACNLDWIEIQFKYMEWNSNFIEFRCNSFQFKFLKWIEFKSNWGWIEIQLDSHPIFTKSNTKLIHKLLKICLPFPSYVTMMFEKEKKLLKNIIKKRRLSIPFITNSKSKSILLKWDDYSKLKPKPIYPKLVPMFALSL